MSVSDEMYPVFATFRDETKIIRDEMTADLLTLGGGEAPGVAERLIRNAHTLKGTSASLGLDDVALLLHGVESLLAHVTQARPPDAAAVDAVLSAIDEVLRRAEDVLVNRVDTGGVQAAHARVQLVLGGLRTTTNQPATLSSPPPRAPGEEVLKIGVGQFEGFTQVVAEAVTAGTRISERARECAVAVQQLRAFTERVAPALTPDVASELERIVANVEALQQNLDDEAELVVSAADELSGGLRMLQLVRPSTIFDPLRRAVHDQARRVGKSASLEIAGADTLVDRRVLQELRGAITHVLRNAVDHGIEDADERRAAGKAERACIRLEVVVSAASLDVTVSDDGRGLDPARIRRAAIDRGVVTAEQADAMDDEAARQLIWRPGLSTSGAVTETSGRGVGLDAVWDCAARLGGTVEVSSVVGHGTTFRFHVPVSRPALA